MEDVRVVIDADALSTLSPMDAVAPLWWGVELRCSPQEYETQLAPFTRRQRLVFAMAWHGAEVGNGGHDQFFWNTTGVVWRDALDGYREAEIHDVASMLEEAVHRLGGNPPLEKIARCELMNALKPNFDDVDDAFYPLLNSTLGERIMAYARAHAADFAFDGIVRKPKDF